MVAKGERRIADGEGRRANRYPLLAIRYWLFCSWPLVLCSWLFVLCPLPGEAAEKVAFARRGVVVCENPRAADIGADILRQGGNAVDAAVAVGFALAVLFPQAGNVGGGGFMIIYRPDSEAYALDFREQAPSQATPDMYLDPAGNVIPDLSTHGYLAVAVPGTPAGLFEAHRRFGRLPWPRLLRPAIELAARGFETDTSLYLALRRDRDRLLKDPEFARIFFDGTEPKGRIVQPELARTLRTLAAQGAQGFYTGWVAEAIEEAMRRHGGRVTREDLAEYRPLWREPVQFSVGDATVFSMPLPSAGGWMLKFMFTVLENLRTPDVGWHSALHVNLVVEAAKQAYAERAHHMGDPDRVPFPTFLDTPAYFRAMAQKIRPYRVQPAEAVRPTLRPLYEESPETTHYSVLDAQGMAVAVTYTLNDLFGAGVIVPGTGILLNNEMDDFSLKPGVPNLYGLTGGDANAVGPRKRMLSSMTPTVVVRDGQVLGLLGSPGGATIVTTVYQVLENLLIFRMEPFLALTAPRFHHQWMPDEIRYEPTAFSGDTLRVLQGLGYRLQPVPALGRVQMIWQWQDGYLGLSDPRSPGSAAGWR
ncbi:Gamma-glutamyltranspeptidase [bacterium HR11]|nr:Gamma-glutamyltranspeptidase [bacterium HR11]